jgi:hypothetical protein
VLGSGDSSLPKKLASFGCNVISVDYHGLNEPRKALGDGFIEKIRSNVLELSNNKIEKADVIILSLLTPFISRIQLHRLWKTIELLLKQNGKVLYVDLHPVSKMYFKLPWKISIRKPKNYWYNKKNEAFILSSRKGKSKLKYYQYSLAEIINLPLEHNRRLEKIIEFPQSWNKRKAIIPGYILTKWTHK